MKLVQEEASIDYWSGLDEKYNGGIPELIETNFVLCKIGWVTSY